MIAIVEHAFYVDGWSIVSDASSSRIKSSANSPRPPIYRWECGCRRPPVLLAQFDLTGRIEITGHDRYWQVDGRIATNCPKCGKQHVLQLTIDPDVLAALPRPWREDRR